jgi:DNA-directed RNA polymerase subunit F
MPSYTTFYYHTIIIVLSNAQVAVILQASAESATNRDEELNQIYQKTHSYVNRFNLMTNAEKQRQEIVDELDNLQEYVNRLCIVWTRSIMMVRLPCHPPRSI